MSGSKTNTSTLNTGDPMIGAIVGDIAGSLYEFHNIKTRDFTLFADYLRVAAAAW